MCKVKFYIGGLLYINLYGVLHLSKHKSAVLAGAFIALTQLSGAMFPSTSQLNSPSLELSIPIDQSKNITINQGDNSTVNLK